MEDGSGGGVSAPVFMGVRLFVGTTEGGMGPRIREDNGGGGMGCRTRRTYGQALRRTGGWVPAPPCARRTGGCPVFTRTGSDLPPSRGEGFVGAERSIFIVMTCFPKGDGSPHPRGQRWGGMGCRMYEENGRLHPHPPSSRGQALTFPRQEGRDL